MLSRVVYTNNVPPMFHGEHCKKNAGSLNDDVRRNIMINFMLTWHNRALILNGQLEIEM